jgi:hypothetical protein
LVFDVDLAVAAGVLEHADRAPEQRHRGLLLAGFEGRLCERAADLEGFLHERDAEVAVGRAGEVADADLDFAHRQERGGFVLAEQVHRAHAFGDTRVQIRSGARRRRSSPVRSRSRRPPSRRR